MQAFVVYGQPTPESSTANRIIIERLRGQLPDAECRTVVELRGHEARDVAAEQEALRRADVVISVFPFYWYSFPAVLKEWIDDVFTHGFAYGTNGTASNGKRIVFFFTTGAEASGYVKDGPMGWPIEAFLPPLLQTARMCGFAGGEVVYSTGMMYVPGVSTEADRKAVLGKAQDHAARLAALINAQ